MTRTFLASALVAAGCAIGAPPSPAPLETRSRPLSQAVGALSTARTGHTTTLLSNGLLLVVGGCSGTSADCSAGTVLATSELGNPATGRFSSAAALSTARALHTATLLPSGRVLVTGGLSGTALTSCEMFDPATGNWAVAHDLTTARFGHTATLLSNGKVLVAGGGVATAELYDPAANSWTATSKPMSVARAFHTAVRLPTGQVLVAGGQAAGAAIKNVDLFDPATGSWTPGKPLAAARYAHSATLLADGSVLVAGGLGASPLATAEIFDGHSWAAASPLAHARSAHSATLLPNGQLLVAGGQAATALGSLELYEPTSKQWNPEAAANVARAGHTATMLPSGNVLLVGGFGKAALDSTELITVAVGTTAAGPALPAARAGHSVTLLSDGTVLVAGNISADEYAAADVSGLSARCPGPTDNTAAIFDPITGGGQWKSIDPAGAVGTATLLPSGKVLTAGGGKASLYDPAKGTWTTTGNMIAFRNGHSATLLPSGKVLVAGGCDQSGKSLLKSAEIFDELQGTWKAAGDMTTTRAMHSATLLPNGKVFAAGSSTLIGNDQNNSVSGEVYDPDHDSWAGVTFNPRKTPRSGHAAVLLPSGLLLLVGYGAELYDPATQSWSSAGAPPALDSFTHGTATLLGSGEVLVTGGGDFDTPGKFNVTDAAYLYRPASGLWTTLGVLNAPRAAHTATLLPSGKVLLAGGLTPVKSGATTTGDAALASTEIFDDGRGAVAGAIPTLAGPLGPSTGLARGATVGLSGTLFLGLSEGASGGTASSPANFPLLMLQRTDNQQTGFATVTAWTSNASATAKLPATLTAGPHWARLVVNGVSSVAQPVDISSSCDSSLKACGSLCLAKSACCQNKDCGTGGSCAEGVCACDTTHKVCSNLCIAASACCLDTDCGIGATCTGNACVCDRKHKNCATTKSCAPADGCCTDAECGTGRTCVSGACTSAPGTSSGSKQSLEGCSGSGTNVGAVLLLALVPLFFRRRRAAGLGILVMILAQQARADEPSPARFFLGGSVLGEAVGRHVGGEVGASYVLRPGWELGAGFKVARNLGGALQGSLEFGTWKLRPFAALRATALKIPEGLAGGFGAGLGVRFPLRVGRLSAAVLGEGFVAPAKYSATAALVLVGYEFGFRGRTGSTAIPSPVESGSTTASPAPATSTSPATATKESVPEGYGFWRGRVSDLDNRPLQATLRFPGAAGEIGSKIFPATPDFAIALPPGSHHAVAIAEGYLARARTMDVNARQTTNGDFQLRPEPRARTAQLANGRLTFKQPLEFSQGEARLLPASLAVLDEVTDLLLRHPSIRLRIEGSLDPRAQSASLPEDRAYAVMEYLIEGGVAADRLEARGGASTETRLVVTAE